MSYATKSDVIAIATGLTVDEIQQDWLDWADAYIDQITFNKFKVSNEVIEKFDIYNTSTDTIFLNNYPIYDVSYVKDDTDTVSTDDYVIYKEEGMIRLKLESYFWKVIKSWFFTKGYQSVEVKYRYGIGKAPDIINYFATLLTVNLAINAFPSTASNMTLTKETIGDYSYSRAMSGKESPINNLKQEIERVENLVKKMYSNEPITRGI